MKCGLAIDQHLLTNPECATTYGVDSFKKLLDKQGCLVFSLRTRKGCVDRRSLFSLLDSDKSLQGPFVFNPQLDLN